jgi:hypothetical protein
MDNGEISYDFLASVVGPENVLGLANVSPEVRDFLRRGIENRLTETATPEKCTL